MERLMSSLCCRTSLAPQGKQATSQQTSSLSRTQHSLSTAGHDNGQTAEKRRSRQAIDRRVSALATSKTGLGRCSACTDVLTEVGPPVKPELTWSAQEHRNRQAKDKRAGCDLDRLLAVSVEGRWPDKAPLLAIRPCMGPWRRENERWGRDRSICETWPEYTRLRSATSQPSNLDLTIE